MKNEHYKLFYFNGPFALQNFTYTYVDNYTFFSENLDQNSKYEENFSITSGNKTKNILPTDYFLKIPFGIDNPSPPQDDSPPVMPSRIISTIPMGTNSNIPSGDFLPIPPRDLSNISEDTIDATFNKSTSFAYTNYKIHLFDPGHTITAKPNSNSTSNPIPHLKLSESTIRQHIWRFIFNDKQEPKDV